MKIKLQLRKGQNIDAPYKNKMGIISPFPASSCALVAIGGVPHTKYPVRSEKFSQSCRFHL